MGSEGPSAVTTVHVTGFKKFHGVSENPTETIASNLKGFMQKKGLPKGLLLGSCNILETAGQGAIAPLYKILESAMTGRDTESSNAGRVIWIHFGVNSGATRFAIENQAVNEATFRCPDELGWKPQKVPIIPSDGGISRTRETSLPVKEIVKALAKMGYEVMPSDDAGRFVCNYVYYHSLRFAEEHGIRSLFVHVPLFLTIDEETQMQFVGSLLEVVDEIQYSSGDVFGRCVHVIIRFYEKDMHLANPSPFTSINLEKVQLLVPVDLSKMEALDLLEPYIPNIPLSFRGRENL